MSERIFTKCSRSCRYFDGFKANGASGDCRAKGGSMHRTVRVPFGGLASVSAHPEVRAGQNCLYRGPYSSPEAWEPEHMVPAPPKREPKPPDP